MTLLVGGVPVPPGDYVYHYTSLASLKSIVESNSMWASDVQYLNDAAEIRHTIGLLRDQLVLRLQDKGLGEKRTRLLSQFGQWLDYGFVMNHSVFVISLSKNGNLLSQWRAYTPHGAGVSIGFDLSVIRDIAKKNNFRLVDCIYDGAKQSQLTADFLQKLETYANTGEQEDRSKRHPSQSFYAVFESLEDELITLAIQLKHWAFREEQEIRLISPIIRDYKKSEIQYRGSRSALIPYVSVDITDPLSNKAAIDYVILGPTPNANLSMNSVVKFLSGKATLRFGVASCQIPYREW